VLIIPCHYSPTVDFELERQLALKFNSLTAIFKEQLARLNKEA